MRFISLNYVDNLGWYLHRGADIGLEYNFFSPSAYIDISQVLIH
jgi:hypothetical protein